MNKINDASRSVNDTNDDSIVMLQILALIFITGHRIGSANANGR
jgi:hypothetical protein